MKLQNQPPWPVLMMSWSLGPGGTERQVAECAQALDRSIFTPYVGSFHAQGVRADELRKAGIPVVEFPVRSFVRPSILGVGMEFVSWLRHHRIAIVQAFDYPTVTFGVPLSRLAGVPVVLASQRGERTLFPTAYQWMQKVTDKLAHHVMANSEFMRTCLTQEYGVREDKVSVCYNGIDTSVFHAEGRTRKPRVQGAACVLGCVAVQRPEKRLDTLIAAFAELQRRDPELRLVLVGDGESRAGLEEQVRGLSLEGRVLFEAATQEVAPWYRSIDIFVLPSSSEAFSNSLLEAMACGCCVVASSVGGNLEAVNARCGKLFPAGDVASLTAVLEGLIAAPEERQRLAAAAAERVRKEFSREVAAARVAVLYRHFLQR